MGGCSIRMKYIGMHKYLAIHVYLYSYTHRLAYHLHFTLKSFKPGTLWKRSQFHKSHTALGCYFPMTQSGSSLDDPFLKVETWMFAWEDDKIQEDPLFPRAETGTREEQGKCLGSDTQVQSGTAPFGRQTWLQWVQKLNANIQKLSDSVEWFYEHWL